MMDYSADSYNTVGAGHQIQVIAEVGHYLGEEISYKTTHSNPAFLKSLLSSEINTSPIGITSRGFCIITEFLRYISAIFLASFSQLMVS